MIGTWLWMQLDATKIHDSRAGAQLSSVETVLACGCFCYSCLFKIAESLCAWTILNLLRFFCIFWETSWNFHLYQNLRPKCLHSSCCSTRKCQLPRGYLHSDDSSQLQTWHAHSGNTLVGRSSPEGRNDEGTTGGGGPHAFIEDFLMVVKKASNILANIIHEPMAHECRDVHKMQDILEILGSILKPPTTSWPWRSSSKLTGLPLDIWVWVKHATPLGNQTWQWEIYGTSSASWAF